jgi:zinc transporter ZupT
VIFLDFCPIGKELPHKLGDFAILLASGMSFKMALICNFVNSCFIYGGLILGIVLGESFKINHWIYALAGGMFIYVAVCNMVG